MEEVVTFFDEVVTNGQDDGGTIKAAADELQHLTVDIITFLSTHGNPGKNRLLKKFVRRLAQTDVLVTFNWDTLLERALARQKGFHWHPSWGYGRTVRNEFSYAARTTPAIPSKYPRLLKLHGSINWVAHQKNGTTRCAITRDWGPGDHSADVVMMPPKMIKPEVWGRRLQSNATVFTGGNQSVSDKFYPALWKEAEEQLARSRRIVFIGYSFPPADFAVGNMLRRAISYMKVETGEFPDVDIVDPNASQIAERFDQSFKIKVPISNRYLSLESYLDSARAS